MSHSQLTRDELDDRLDRLEDRLADVEQGVNRGTVAFRKAGTTSERLVGDLGDRVDVDEDVLDEHGSVVEWCLALQKTVEQQADRIDDLETERDRLSRERSALARRLTAVETDLDVDPGALGDGGTPLPLDLLAQIGPDAVDSQPGVNLERAYVLARNRIEWGESRHNSKYGHHHVLASDRHDLKKLLSAAREEELEWVQIHRAMEKCADLGGNAVELVEYDDWGKALVDRRGELS